MAPPRSGAGGRSTSRAQLFLVTAFVLATLLVIFALLLNTAIYTENLATREGTAGDRAVQFQRNARYGVSNAVYDVDYHRSLDFVTLDERYRRAVGNWSDDVRNYRVVDDQLTNVAPDATTNGTLVSQDAPDTLTGKTDDPSWTVATANATRRFELNLTTADLRDYGGPYTESGFESSSAFRIEASGGGDDWTLYVFRNGADPVVAVVNETGLAGTYTASGAHVTVDVTEGRVDGRSLSWLRFPGVPAPYTISVAHGDQARGRYLLVVDDPSLATDGRYYDRTENATPYATPAIYDARVRLRYDDPAVALDTNLTVAPESPPCWSFGNCYGVDHDALGVTYVTGGRLVTATEHLGNLSRAPSSVTGVSATGPRLYDLGGDGRVDTPYVTTGGDLGVVDATNATTTLASGAKPGARLGVGVWDSNPPSVFYADASDHLYRVDASGTPVPVYKDETHATDPVNAVAVAGVTDFNGDGDNDVVIVTPGDDLAYVETNGVNHTVTDLGVTLADSSAVGDPVNLDGDSAMEVPYYDGSSVKYADASGPEATVASVAASAYPLTSYDVVGDRDPELLYVNATGDLTYVALDGTTGAVTDENGALVAADSSGVT